MKITISSASIFPTVDAKAGNNTSVGEQNTHHADIVSISVYTVPVWAFVLLDVSQNNDTAVQKYRRRSGSPYTIGGLLTRRPTVDKRISQWMSCFVVAIRIIYADAFTLETDVTRDEGYSRGVTFRPYGFSR